jgi:metallo-beta-lactamase family protein
MAKRVVGRGVVPDERAIRPLLDEVFTLVPGEPPRRETAPSRGRRPQPEAVGLPDWHNVRAALLLDMEAVLDEAGDDVARVAVLNRLRPALRPS